LVACGAGDAQVNLSGDVGVGQGRRELGTDPVGGGGDGGQVRGRFQRRGQDEGGLAGR